VRPWNLERKLVVAVLALFLVPTVVAGVILAVLYRRGMLEDPAALLLTCAIGFTAMMAYLGLMAHGLGAALVQRLQEIQRGTELMATVHPDHRLPVQRGDEIDALAGEINRMADRVREARGGLEAQIEQATRALGEERAKLSAILAELDEGVLVATLDGLVTLANPVAQELLGAPTGSLLGRSLFDFVDRAKIAHFLERLRAGQSAAERFSLQPASGAVLHAGMTPFQGPHGGLTGFILALRDVSRPTHREEERRRLLTETLEGLRGPLSSVRSLSESLLGDPSFAPGSGSRPLLEAIHAEAVRLSSLVASAGASAPMGLAGAPWHLEQIAVGDLIAVSLGRLAPTEMDRNAVRVESPAPEPRLRAEVSALSAVFAHLLGRLLAMRAPAGAVWVRTSPRGRVIQIEAGADGQATLARLEELLEAGVTVGPAGCLRVREIVRRHAGEVWAVAGAGRVAFRFTLPVEETREGAGAGDESPPSGDRFVGAGTVSGFGRGDAEPDWRRDFYDFSFFDQMERSLPAAHRARSLDELTFVVLDTETTGLHPEAGDRVLSIAGVRVRDGTIRRSEVFDALVNPGRPIPVGSIRFHGITDAMVAEAPLIDVVLPAFLRFAEGAVLVGHEVWFDLRCLEPDMARLGLPSLSETRPVLDSLLLSQAVHASTPDHSLDAVAARLGVKIRGRHSALGDALATAEILVRLLDLLKKRDIRTLGQALDAARAVRTRGLLRS
jgi:DNA polymerase-3 subunit epsilon